MVVKEHLGARSARGCVLLLSAEMCSLFWAWGPGCGCPRAHREQFGGGFFAGSSITCGAPSWVAPRQFPPQPALCCCQCSGLFEGQLQGKLWAGSGRRGLSPRPCFPVMVTSPSNQLTAFRHFLPLLSCGFWCVFVHVLPFGERDGGWGRSPQCLKGSG